MFRIRFSLVFLPVVLLGLSSCATITAEQLIADGATRLDEAQVRAHISGKTERFPSYATYYSPDGKLDLRWDKANNKGTWDVSADGNVCLYIADWNKLCHFYVNNHGAITTIEKGYAVGVYEVVEGRYTAW